MLIMLTLRYTYATFRHADLLHTFFRYDTWLLMSAFFAAAAMPLTLIRAVCHTRHYTP